MINVDKRYKVWSEERMNAIVNELGKNFFLGKTVLDIGCGHCLCGQRVERLGAIVTFADARPHCNEVVFFDAEKEWTLGSFDIILNLGLLYHVQNPVELLYSCGSHCQCLVLESRIVEEVAILRGIRCKELSNREDQAFSGFGSRMSSKSIEFHLHKLFGVIKRLVIDSHVYNYQFDLNPKHKQQPKEHRGLWVCHESKT